jgi:hypothetical protein
MNGRGLGNVLEVIAGTGFQNCIYPFEFIAGIFLADMSILLSYSFISIVIR